MTNDDSDKQCNDRPILEESIQHNADCSFPFLFIENEYVPCQKDRKTKYQKLECDSLHSVSLLSLANSPPVSWSENS